MMVTEMRRWRKSLFLALFLIGMVPWLGCGSTGEAAGGDGDTAATTNEEEIAQTVDDSAETTLTIASSAMTEALDAGVGAALVVSGAKAVEVNPDPINCQDGGTAAAVGDVSDDSFDLTITLTGCENLGYTLNGDFTAAGGFSNDDADGDGIPNYTLTSVVLDGDVTVSVPTTDNLQIDLCAFDFDSAMIAGTAEGVSNDFTLNGNFSIICSQGGATVGTLSATCVNAATTSLNIEECALADAEDGCCVEITLQ